MDPNLLQKALRLHREEGPQYQPKSRDPVSLVLRFDGAAAPNPGPSGAGAVVYLLPPGASTAALGPADEIIAAARHVGVGSNNRAEYRGLLLGLDCLQELAGKGYTVQEVKVEGDS